MLKKDRKRYILACLQKHSTVTVASLSEALSLSEVSVRKLLDEMEKEGSLRRTWGGAASAMGTAGDSSYEEKLAHNIDAKKAIATAAYACIQDGDAIYIDSGTTTLQLAALLASGSKRQVLVVTNALPIADAFRDAKDMQVVLIGGEYKPKIRACIGGLAREMLRTFLLDKCFVSGSHFSIERGFTTPDLQEAVIKRLVLSSSKEAFFLADASKYGTDSLSLIAATTEMGTLITDWRLEDTVVQAYNAQNVHVIRADKG